MAPFDLLDPAPPGLLDRTPDRNAYVELHNMVAAARNVYEFGPLDTLRIGRDHGVDFVGTDGGAFAAERADLYAAFLQHRLADGDLTPAERDAAAHLARTLFLERGALRRLHARVFGRAVADAIADDCLDADEQLLLFTLQHTLGLDPDEAGASYERAARERLLKRVAHALCDGELDPDEADELRAMERDLGVRVPERVQAMLATAARTWRLLHGDLEPIDAPPPVDLRDGERMYWTGVGHWTEVPKSTERSGSRMPFMRRASLQSFIVKLRRRRPDHAGRMALTNERLLLSRYRTGRSDRVRTVALRKVVEATHAEGLVLLSRDGKIDWLLRLDDEAPTFATLVRRLIAPPSRRTRAERDRERRREEEERWKRGDRPSSEEVEAKRRAAARRRERGETRTEEVTPTPLPRYRGPLLFRPERDETVHLSTSARWHADEAVRRAVASDPRVPGDAIDRQRAVLDRQRAMRGEGTLYLTSKRLLLIDPRGDTVMFPLPTISGIAVGKASVEIQRRTQMGRVVLLAEPMAFAELLKRLVLAAQ